MKTIAMERAGTFLRESEVGLETAQELHIEELIIYYAAQVEFAINSLDLKVRIANIFQIDSPSVKEAREYAKLAGWHEHLQQGGSQLLDAYYGAKPYSPYFEDETVFDKLIRAGERELSDKDIWSISFPHPSEQHFYTVKYMPGVGGKGFGYRISACNNMSALANIQASIKSGERYPLDQIVP